MNIKRILFAAVVSFAMAGSFAAPALADQPRGQYSRANDHNDDNRHAQQFRRGDRQWRDTRANARFDVRIHNGYFVKNTWYAGPPPSSAYRIKGFQLGYKPWARGDRLGTFATRYHEFDYRSRHLKAPQRGYHYVQDDNGDILLAAIATGLIAAVIASN